MNFCCSAVPLLVCTFSALCHPSSLDVETRARGAGAIYLSTLASDVRKEIQKTDYRELSYCCSSLANVRDACAGRRASAPSELRYQSRQLTVGRELELIINDGPRVLERIVDDAPHVLGRLDFAQVEPEALGEAMHRQVVLVGGESCAGHERGSLDNSLTVGAAGEEGLDGQLGELTEAGAVASAHEDHHLMRELEGAGLEFDALGVDR
jgi:hypothetical protein